MHAYLEINRGHNSHRTTWSGHKYVWSSLSTPKMVQIYVRKVGPAFVNNACSISFVAKGVHHALGPFQLMKREGINMKKILISGEFQTLYI